MTASEKGTLSTSYRTNDPLAVKLWSKCPAVEVLKQTWLHKFMGEGSSNVFQNKDETKKSAGGRVTYGLRMKLSDLGVTNAQGAGTESKPVSS